MQEQAAGTSVTLADRNVKRC